MKRHMKVILAAAAAILLLAAVVASAHAQNAGRRAQVRQQAAGRAMFRAGIFLRGLDLTDAQREQVKGILESHKAEMQASAKEQVQARRVLGRALADGASETALKAAFDQVTSAEWNTIQLRSRMLSEFKQILTAEQLARLQERLRKVDGRIQTLLERKRK